MRRSGFLFVWYAMGRQISVAEVGSIVANARVKTTAFSRKHKSIFKKMWSLNRDRSLIYVSDDERLRLSSVSILFESAFKSGLYSVHLFRDGYDAVFQGKHDFEESVAKDGLLDCVHTHADSIPIALFNAFKISQSTEFVKLTRLSKSELADCFIAHFPKVVDARDAVAHYHDRALGRYMTKQFSDRPSFSPIFNYGKTYIDSSGDEFDFEYDESIFSRYLDDLERIVP